MKRIDDTRRFDIPIERAFAFITDPGNWPKFWPGFVALVPGSRWGAVGDTTRLVSRLLGRDRELTMTLTTFDTNRLVAYRSVQDGLPDVHHERAFTPDGDGFIYGLAAVYTPRPGLAGLFDRIALPRAIRRAFTATFDALEREMR
jgi:hypothetical protein